MTARNTTYFNNRMEMDRWLIVSAKGATRVASTPVSLGKDEIAIKVHLDLPLALFRKPSLEAQITVPSDAVLPVVIPPRIITKLGAEVQRAIGFDVVVKQLPAPPAK